MSFNFSTLMHSHSRATVLYYFIVFPLISDMAKGFDSNKICRYLYPCLYTLYSNQKTTYAKHRMFSHLVFIEKS